MTTAGAKASVLRAAKACVRGHTSQAVTPSINERHARAAEDTAAQRELFMNVLNSQATKRDAKQYIARFNQPGSLPKPKNADQQCGVNLGRLYTPPGRAIAESPQFVRHRSVDITAREGSGILTSSVALVCLKDAQTLDEETVDGLALTLAQLVRLDMRLVLVLDGEDIDNQLRRVSRAVSQHSSEGARVVVGALDAHDDGRVSIGIPSLLHEPLRRGIVPVLPARAHTSAGCAIRASVSSTMLALTQHLSNQTLSLDRIILLDTAGGIPSRAREDNSHVFINLQQEFLDIKNELDEYKTSGRAQGTDFAHHGDNLELVHKCLMLLPPASSALIVSPLEAASSARESRLPSTGTGTRRQRNTLIHNLLTNRPMVSSSLPTARLLQPSTPAPQAATLLKQGMPLAMIPQPDPVYGWQRPPSGYTQLSLNEDPRIDWPRLVALIEDSFRRKLDVAHYLQRIEGRVAGVIIAGDYEGGAILTWEQPPGTRASDRLVPYLDKFVVAQSSQGASGTADIVFQAMVRTCFPDGVCWRSRQVNPVNRWYFERSEGSWKIPNSTWSMFWTGSKMLETRFHDCLSVCQSIEPSLH